MGGVLSGKVALITGGSGGIGSSAAELLLKDGAKVVLMGRTKDKLERARERLSNDHGRDMIEISAGDATSQEDLASAVERCRALSDNLDILVSTVGGARAFGLIVDQGAPAFRDEMETNFLSAVMTLNAAAPIMINGSAIFVSSVAALNPFPKIAPYVAAKAALEQFVRTAADEMSERGIRVNAVRAGMTRTAETEAFFENEAALAAFDGLIPLRRFGDPADIAHAIRFLAGPESDWVTGQMLTVDGGQSLRRNPTL